MLTSPVSTPCPRRGRVTSALSAVAVSVVLLGSVACSSDDDDAASTSTTEAASATTTAEGELPELTAFEQKYADAVLDTFEEGSELFSGADNECLSVRWVDVIGEARLKESGITTEDFAQQGPGALNLDQAVGEQMVEAMELCGSSLAEEYESFAVDEETGKVDAEVLACMKATAPLSEYRAAMASSFTGDNDAALAAVGKKWEACS